MPHITVTATTTSNLIAVEIVRYLETLTDPVLGKVVIEVRTPAEPVAGTPDAGNISIPEDGPQ